MVEEIYSGEYAILVKLADLAWTNKDFFSRIRSGELERVIQDHPGITRVWRGSEEKFQNIAIVNNEENALSLIQKLNSFPYIKELILSKDKLRLKEGCIPLSSKYSSSFQ